MRCLCSRGAARGARRGEPRWLPRGTDGPEGTPLGGEAGQGTVEFAVVAPLLVFLLLGLVAAGWLLFEYEAVADAARSGVREAIVETALLAFGGCESGQPRPIEQAVQMGATIVPVDSAPLCQDAGDPSELVQAPGAVGVATVTVVGTPSLSPADMSEVTVTVTLPVRPFPPLPGLAFDLSASSTLPVE